MYESERSAKKYALFKEGRKKLILTLLQQIALSSYHIKTKNLVSVVKKIISAMISTKPVDIIVNNLWVCA